MKTKIGGDNRNLEEIMGKEEFGQMNENGKIFVEYCHTSNLVIGGNLFPHKKIHKSDHMVITRWLHEKPNGPYHYSAKHITYTV